MHTGRCILALRPTDAAIIRSAGVFGFVVFVFVGLFCFYAITLRARAGLMVEVGLYAVTAILILLCAGLLTPFLACACCCGGKCPAFLRLPPRLLRLRLWLTLRLFYVAFAAACVGFFLRPLDDAFPGSIAPTGRADDVQTGLLAVVISFLLAALVFTNATRGRVIRWLGSRLGKGGAKAQEAASVAALLGKRSAADTYATAAKRFRALPLSSLTLDELAENKPDPELYKKTASATLGAVHAFVSHSWSDAGAAKFDGLHEWDNEQASRRSDAAETLIWCDTRTRPASHSSTRASSTPLPVGPRRLDKACIDQQVHRYRFLGATAVSRRASPRTEHCQVAVGAPRLPLGLPRAHRALGAVVRVAAVVHRRAVHLPQDGRRARGDPHLRVRRRPRDATRPRQV